MKKCPFCKADIEDNARFCLYCMRPLNEKEVIPPLQKKRQWWPLAVVGVLLLALLVVILLIPRGHKDLPTGPSGAETASGTQTPESTGETTQDAQGEADVPPEETEPKDRSPGRTDTNQTPDTIPPEPESNDVTPALPEDTTPITTPPTQPEETTAPTQPEETTAPTTAPEPPKTEVTYTYRTARAGDEYYANYTNSGNDIVITGITQQSPNGTYDIPSYIDGKRVIAIMANAFYGSNAKVVYIPATVKSIWNYAFNGCALTDIYFRGSAIYVESKAFSGSLTIHCAASCSTRNYRYYKDCAANYGATWEEWNG